MYDLNSLMQTYFLMELALFPEKKIISQTLKNFKTFKISTRVCDICTQLESKIWES